MVIGNFRSLLLAVIVLSNCITWTSSRHHFKHHVLRHRSRHRRQGAGLYLAASYVLPGGEGGGAWGPWGEVSPCSRTCGGGVASQKRICLEIGPDGQPRCAGGDTKYFSCETHDCPAGAADFRSEQCAEYNNVTFRGVTYNWIPYTKAPNPCELNCRPRGERFYYRQARQVVDGTRCNEESFDVCVNGECQPVGCDMMLGSNAKEDKCRECRGNGTNCHTANGRIDNQDLTQGYNDVLLIPQGATNIYIAEVRASNNYLALRSKQYNNYYLNGDYHIDFPRSISIAGALWQYERSQQGFPAPDKLRCLGPTNEPLYLSLLLQDVNVGIEYEYSIPKSIAPPPNQQYNWVFDEFTPCSASCGGGIQYRNVTCRSREDLDVVDSSLCDEGLRPATNQTCANHACAARWVEGPWSPCSKPCGEAGTRSRAVYCEKVISNGRGSVVDDSECFNQLGPKPELYQECNKNSACPSWFTGPWKACDKLCGEGKQTRQVVCHQKTNGKVEVFPDKECADEKPPSEQSCMIHPCEGVDWVVSDWVGCDSCLSKERTRQAECATKDRTVVNSTFCSYHPMPVLKEDCDRTKLPPCTVQWYATQWSNCSVECGHGVKVRRIFCGLFDGTAVIKVDDSRCSEEEKYNETTPCEIPDEKCPAKWFGGPWSECTKECGGGEQFRHTMCLKGSLEASDCDPEAVLDSSQACNTQACNKDEIIPVDSKSTPIMDEDYEDEECEEEEEEYPEVGAEESLEGEEDTASSVSDIMFSDSPSTDITEEGSGMESTLFTSSDTETSDEGSAFGSTTELEESLPTSETVSEGSTESVSEGSTEAGESSTTEAGISGSTETLETDVTSSSSDATEVTGESDSTTESSTDVTGATEESGSTEAGGSTEANTGASDSTDQSTTESGSSEASTESASEATSESSTIEESTTEGSTESSTDGASTTDSGSTESSTSASESSDSASSVTTEESSTDFAGTTEDAEITESSGATEASASEGSTETEVTESAITEVTESGATDVTGSEATEETGGSTVTESTEETGSTVTEETGSTVTEETEETGGSTATEETGSTVTEESVATESEGSTVTEETEATSELSSKSTTPWDWYSTVEGTTKHKVCKPRKKKAKCKKSKFGCCPDKRTPAAGPFDEGCPNPKTCKESKYGCCPDGVSPAQGEKNEECPQPPCKETLYGCCKSDNKTPAEGNNEEGCPPPPPKCKSSKYGCCKDGKTEATGPKKKGCPETAPKKGTKGCAASPHGCCSDGKTEATGPNGAGCPCNITEFGCCPDNVSPARGPQMEGCVMSCNTSAYGCCPDGETPAHGPDNEGCCLLYSFGCCPDNYKPAEGPQLQGCGCQYAKFGCCPDNITIAHGTNKEGCGCQYTQHGCCPDRHTEAAGPNYEGCGCHTYQFGCCPDGTTIAKGPNLYGCHCSQSQFGCCGDGQTAAKGPEGAGCDCAASKHGCCPDGQTEATGEKFAGCADIPVNRQASCALKTDRGPCRNYSVSWYYDIEYGGCSRFWYGGCEGNGNRFSSQEECQDVCVHPSPKDACKLPKSKGACQGYNLHWYFDTDRQQCGQFVYGGCLGNDNNFETRDACQDQCEPARSGNQCHLPLERGSCAGNFNRWGYNKEAGRCEQFTWGGCEGNGNRFNSEAACVQKCDPPGALKPECTLPKEPGNCTEKYARWAFSESENRCLPFYFTGCNGNDNNYQTEEECSSRCPSAYEQDTCLLPAETGSCADYREKWYFDSAEQRCRQFYYGGCGGNDNNFNSQIECERRCRQAASTTTTPQPSAPEQFRNEFCFMEVDQGPCHEAEPRWAYDSARGACTQFQYGGCGGNRNNFPSREYCQYYCSPAQDVCQLPMSTGPCEASVMAWFYDASSDSCSQFTYGGCEGNGNRFQSRDECERRCRTGPAAPAPAETTTTAAAPTESIAPQCQSYPEPCTSTGEVWYYDQGRRECVPHQNQQYGAECRNTGVFQSQEACDRSCGAFRGLDVCNSPLDAGPCQAFETKIFFNQTAQACQAFTYGGCHGGPNRFSTVDECEQTCRPRTDDVCNMEQDSGSCDGYYIKWFYDRLRGDCGQFIYTGCGGNQNNFETQEACEGRCIYGQLQPTTALPPSTASQTVQQQVTVTPQATDPKCTTPESLEPCGFNSTVFYYDSTVQDCVAGNIGGCRHPNSYATEEQCQRECGLFRGLDVCRYNLDPGPCKASIPKYFYDPVTGACQIFAYGGCGGGPNRFSTVEECEKICTRGAVPACLEAVDTGREQCEEVPSRRWHFSALDNDCYAFVFSGCGGNGNNFRSYQDCLSDCEPYGINEVTECDAYIEECNQIRCEYGVQSVRTETGCERCLCAAAPSNCDAQARECAEIKCPFGVDKTVGEDNCERCTCKEHLCAGQVCPAGQRCVLDAYRDPVTQESRYNADCRTVNKPGLCPSEQLLATEQACRRECTDDADCRGVGKCCASGCSQLCVAPLASATTPYVPSTTGVPELPQAPQANPQTEPEVMSEENGKATLRCLFHGNPPPKITWQRGKVTIDGTVGRYRLLSDGALEIVQLYRNDSGVYICVANNGLGTARQEVRLQVNDPVERAAGIAGDAGAAVTGELGQALALRCLAYGYPTPTIAWYRGVSGPMVPFVSRQYEARGFVLQIRALDLETIGEYACQAYNGLGKPASWAVVVQAYQPDGQHIDSPFLVARESVVRVTPRLAYTEPTTAATTPEPEPEVPVYTVPVSTRLRATQNKFASGSELSIPCEVDGYPTPEVHWTKDGVRLQPSDRLQLSDARLTISQLAPADSGVYGCHAANAFSSHYATLQITVEGLYIPASCYDNPFFANCALIVSGHFCHHKYYSGFCCNSCVRSGQISIEEIQSLMSSKRRK
ncbi:papilin isoform X3 [Plutella xylostella]|uniref:papilin isoform X3 n=1 Tax=Plutella xylostella TaxID=51655 RepID=UPI002032D269|nr:papilin isoform X3 [Plutella xylostella]